MGWFGSTLGGVGASRAVAGLWHGSLAGLRPVEAQVLLGKAGGVQVFANDAIKASTAARMSCGT